MKNSHGMTIVFIVLLAGFAHGQISAGGQFTLDQTVIAAGGGQNSGGGQFAVDGTIGQTTVGQRATAAPFSIYAGFWNPPQSTTTAAAVMVGGRVITADGRGIRNIRITLTNSNGEIQTLLTGAFGYFRFADVPAGETYIFSVAAKRYQFAQPSQILTINEETDDIVFVALEKLKVTN